MAKPAFKQNGVRISVRRELIEQTRLRLSYERRLRLQMQTAFAEIGAQAQREYQGAGRLVRVEAEVEAKLFSILESHYRSVIDEFGLRILRYRKQESQFEQLIKLFMLDIGAQRITQISNTTRRAIISVILAGEKEGLGVAVIGANIFERMRGSFSRIRAATIARTETHTAASYANHQVNASLNIPDQVKRWVSVSDDRTRSHHTQMNNTEVPLDEDFIVPVNGLEYRMGYTGDPRGGAVNTINCRCVTLYVSPEDEVVD